MIRFRPPRIWLWDPFRMALSLRINGGDPNHLHPHWDDIQVGKKRRRIRWVRFLFVTPTQPQSSPFIFSFHVKLQGTCRLLAIHPSTIFQLDVRFSWPLVPSVAPRTIESSCIPCRENRSSKRKNTDTLEKPHAHTHKNLLLFCSLNNGQHPCCSFISSISEKKTKPSLKIYQDLH